MVSAFKLHTQLVLLVFLLTTTLASWTYSNIQPGWELIGDATAIVTARDQVECVRRCYYTYGSTCIAASFNSNTTACTQFASSKFSIETSSSETVILTQWAKVVLIKTTCIFEDAVGVCASIRGRLMTSSELEDAFNSGTDLKTCRCGWVTGGTPRNVNRCGWVTGGTPRKVHQYFDCGQQDGVDVCNIPGDNTRKTWCIINTD